MDSYFENDKNKIKNINIVCHNKHLEYVPSYSELDKDISISHIYSRAKYVDGINKWLNQYSRELNKPLDSVMNKHICKKIHDELIDLIYSEGFEIKDKVQFKEDIIHYFYSLADLD